MSTVAKVTALVEPRPWILPVPAKILPVDVLVVILVEKLPLSVLMAEILEVAAVILEENELEASVKLPLILVLIWAEELNAPSNIPWKEVACTIPLALILLLAVILP